MSYGEMGLLCSRSRSQQILKCYWMLVQMISFESLNILPPDLVWWCIIMSQIVLKKKNCSAVFKVKVTVKNNIIKIWLFNISFELLILLQINLVWWHIITRWIVLWKDWIALLWARSRSQKRFRMPVNIWMISPLRKKST